MNKNKLDKSNIQDILGLTPMQEGMLFHYLSNSEGKQYLEQLCLTLCGEIDANIIVKAWSHVVQNNEMLRTIFKWDKLDKPLQIILKQYEIPYVQYNLSHINSEDKNLQIMDIKDSELNRKINISENPLRMAIIKLDSSKFELIITYHHILYDGWSNGILIKEFVQACNSLSANRLPSIIKKNNFKEFIRYCHSQDKTMQEAFWHKCFSDYNIKSTITIKTSQVEDCAVNNKIKYKLDKKISESIYEFCKKEKTTVAAMLYTAWGILLQKYNNTNDVVFGTTVSGRNAGITGIEDMVGLFINTLPLRVNSIEDENIQGLLKKVTCILKERDEYQSTPLVDIKAYSGINNKEELFDTLVVIENYPLDQALINSNSSINIEEYSMTEMTNYKITLAIADFKGLELELSYDTSVFEDVEIRRMVGHFENIIVSFIENPVCSISQIDILREEERQQILVDFNNTKTDYPKDKTISILFEEQVERTPNNIAVVYEGNKLTYSELNHRANQLARLLRDKGVDSDSIVAIMVEHSLEMIVGIMGILKAGGAYLPIDPEYPGDRIEYMLQDSGARIILTQAYLSKGITRNIEVIELDNEDIYQGAKNNLDRKGKASELAYIIYTSGSTGKPKGVMIENKGIINTLIWRKRQYDFSEKDAVLQVLSYTFDSSVEDIFTSIISGARLILIKQNQKLNIEYIKHTIIENEITHISLTPSFYKIILNEIGNELNSIKHITLGGESYTKKLVEEHFELLKDVKLFNEYGPTENSVCSTSYKLDKEYYKDTIGKPNDNVRAYIINDNMQLNPIGVIGELCLSGDGLARGYLNNAELTEEKFVDNPFEPGIKMYKTGDLARWLPDGNLEFLGRIDHQVKIRGYRIELGEIENKLISHEAVKEAVVIARDDNSGSKFLCAYVVGTKKLMISELKEYLSKDLPDYMIPLYFIQIDKLPLTSNGKVDRKALLEPDGSIATGAEYEAPRNNIEEKLVTIWGDILGIENIGINDNFFEMGGHSLKATSLVAKIHKLLNIEIPLKEIFKTPTIKGISEYIKNSEESIYSSIERVEEKECYEMSSAQKRLYMLNQLDTNSTNYNMPGVLELEGNLDATRLKEAFNKLIQRHEALRTSFYSVEDGLVQKIHKQVEFEIEEYKSEEAEQIEDIVKSFIRAFNLSKAPLLRVGLIKVNSNKHILMYDMHHIISDGTTMGILIEEFTKAYAGEELTPLRIQYKDFSEWQNKLFGSDSIKLQEEYWLKQFEGEIPVLNLTTDYQRPAVQSFEGDSIEFKINKELTKKLRQIAKDTGSTMYMVLLSTFNILLSKYSGQDDIIVGSPIAGRPHADLENIIGMFVNTLAMRNYPSGEKTFKEFLREVKENALGAYENQDYQFEELVERLKLARDFSRNPVFDVMFVLQNMDMGELAVEGIKISQYKSKNKVSKFDMTVNAVELEDSISIGIQYCTKLFSKTTIERMYKHLENIMQVMTENIDIKLSSLEILTEEEKQQISLDFNNTKADYPKDKTIHQLFEEQAERTPDNIAVVYEGNKLTYRELNERANQLARVLSDKGVGSDSIVAIMVERSLEMIVGIMAILKAGGAYLPIDPQYPEDRITYMLQDSGARILLTQACLYKGIAGDREVIELDNQHIYQEAKDNLDSIAKFNNLAYVIYTSGSTGKPKGVMIENRSVINLVYALKDKIYKDNTGMKIAMVSPYIFDASVKQIFPSLLLGQSLYIVPEDTRYDGMKLVDYYVKNNIDVSDGTPNHLRLIIGNNNNLDAIKVKKFVIGGEALSNDIINRLLGKLINVDIINVYGPTECCVDSTLYVINKNNSNDMVTIGKPLNNYRIYIVDKHLNMCPIGVAGELCICGDGLARGYLNRSELTAEKFTDNPFEQESRMYRTGDLARWLPDGNIEFLGRIDHQVKIRGYRIELGEIENKLLSHEAVKETVVIARDDNSGNKYLCAYVVGQEVLTVSELRSYIAQALPEYMIPSYFIQLEKLPLTSNGKVDRKALPKLETDGSIATGAEYEAPRNAMEEKLVDIWREVLGVERIGINDSFFELGGHSLKATSLVAKIHKVLNIEIPLRQIFKAPTIKGISEYIKDRVESIYSSIQPVEEKGYYEMSSAQKRMYILQQLEPNSTSYNIPRVFELEGNLNIERLKEAFNKLIQKHEALRTSFESVEEGLIQKVHKEVAFELEDYIAETDEEIQGISKDFIRAFDLSSAPLLRVGLIKIHANKHILIFDMHHIISDGTSMGILVEEFTKAYAGEELIPLRIQYKDFSKWQNELLRSNSIKVQEDYWLKQFEGEIPVLNLPIDYQRPPVQSFEGDSIELEIDEELTKKLIQITKATGSTMYMVLLSSINILLSKYSGQEDIIVGSPIAGRPHADLEHIIGMFVNTLAMRNYPSGEKTYKEFLREVKENALGAYENQDYQFEELVEKLKLTRDFSRNPVFDVMFILQNLDMRELAAEGITIKPYKAENRISKFDMIVNAAEQENKISIEIQYCTKLFSKATIEKMFKHLQRIIQSITENIEAKLSEVDMLTKEDTQQILLDFNNTKADYPSDKTIHQLFEEQAERTPDKTAVVYEGSKLTYRELNEKANQLARVLRDKGVVSDSIVGIMVERSLEMIVGIIGILKAGGAYLPIDPEYPQDRIEYMLEDSGANILLTQLTLNEKAYPNIETIFIDDKSIYQGFNHNVENINCVENLIYAIYTSGSTGKPKGVLLPHKAINNLINFEYQKTNINFKTKVLQFTTICFDVFCQEVFSTLLCGGELYIPMGETRKDTNKLLKFIEEKEIEVLFMATAYFKYIVSQPEYIQNLSSSIKHIIVAGEQLLVTEELKNYLRKTKVFLHNHYGPSETHVVTTYTINCEGDISELTPIGRPISNSKIYIVDKYNNLQPIGVVGELCITGDGLARGYLNRPELTADKFVDNPSEPGTRMYKTGDQARWLQDGNIEFMGRIDHQVKIRGYRIELGEIENKLLSHEAVKEAVVIARVDNNGNGYLCAYIAESKQLTIAELRKHLGKALPDYMIPAYFIQIDKLPLTPNGKVDKKALPEPDGNISTGVEYEAPRNATEENLVEIWREVLGVKEIGINDNFFELGGHSLKATSLLASIHKELSVEIPLREIFIAPTIKEMSKYIMNSAESTYSQIQPLDKSEYYEISYSQKRLWILHQLEPNSIAYNIFSNFTLYEELDEAAFDKVFEKIIERHESLRTSFDIAQGEPVQRINDVIAFNVKKIDISGTEDKLRSQKRQEIISLELNKPFDLQKAPLYRVLLVKYKNNEYEIMICMHHIISDGWSLELMQKEFIQLYNSYKNNLAIELKPLRVQYKDFAAWQNSLMKDAVKMEKAKEFWIKSMSGGNPILSLPISNSVSLNENGSNGYRCTISSALKDKLKQLTKEHNSSLYSILLGILNIYFSYLTGQEDITIASAGSGRQHYDTKGIVGFFINTMFIRNKIDINDTFEDILKRVNENIINVLEYQSYPLELLLDELKISYPKIPVFFNMLNMGENESDLIEDFESHHQEQLHEIKFDLIFYVREYANAIELLVNYRSNLFEPDIVENMVNQYIKLMEYIAENNRGTIKDYKNKKTKRKLSFN